MFSKLFKQLERLIIKNCISLSVCCILFDRTRSLPPSGNKFSILVYLHIYTYTCSVVKTTQVKSNCSSSGVGSFWYDSQWSSPSNTHALVSSASLEYGLDLVNSFQRAEYGKSNETSFCNWVTVCDFHLARRLFLWLFSYTGSDGTSYKGPHSKELRVASTQLPGINQGPWSSNPWGSEPGSRFFSTEIFTWDYRPGRHFDYSLIRDPEPEDPSCGQIPDPQKLRE